MSTQYRALLTCTSDPCGYCDGPARTIVVGAAVAGVHDDKVFPTAAEAGAYGLRMAHNVYGASAHRVSVESRPVGEWAPVDELARVP